MEDFETFGCSDGKVKEGLEWHRFRHEVGVLDRIKMVSTYIERVPSRAVIHDLRQVIRPGILENAHNDWTLLLQRRSQPRNSHRPDNVVASGIQCRNQSVANVINAFIPE
jgi:hypothetical protein